MEVVGWCVCVREKNTFSSHHPNHCRRFNASTFSVNAFTTFFIAFIASLASHFWEGSLGGVLL